ncbi:MAG: LCP family protein [Oscillospiraceae bacterium]|jgi:LCP family protein required for cell wall assembly
MSANNRNKSSSGSRIQGGKRGGKSGFRKWMFVPLILAVIVVGIFISYKMMVRPPSVGQGILQEDGTKAEPTRVQGSGRKQDFYTFLLCGTDDGNGGTDTIMIAAYDVKNQKMNVMSIPRDTMVNVSWSTKKINSTYNAGGISRLAREAGNLIGFPLDFYIKIDLEGFVELIDALDGVDFEVPCNMNYEDPTQNLSIHVKKGMQHLNGKDAVGVVRWRKNNDGTGYSSGDIGRIQTQQAFLKAVGKKCLNLGNITKVKEFAEIFSKYVETNLSLGNLIWLGQQGLGLDLESIHFFTMPGNYAATHQGVSYVTPDARQLVTAVNTYLNPYLAQVTSEDLDVMSITSGGKLVSSKGQLASGVTASSGTQGSSAGNAAATSAGTAAPSAAPKQSKAPAAPASSKPSAAPKQSAGATPSAQPTHGATAAPTAKPSNTPIPIETKTPGTAEPTEVIPIPTGALEDAAD